MSEEFREKWKDPAYRVGFVLGCVILGAVMFLVWYFRVTLGLVPGTIVPLMLYEHEGDNRSGKTFLMALWGFFDWLAGRIVYANCRPDKGFTGGYDCFINYPHLHYEPTDLYYMPEVHDCTVITDESGEYMDSRKSGSDEVIDIGNFGKQATKQDVDWHWDTVYHDEIEKRIRRKWHYQIRTTRVPLHPKKPLLFIRIESRNRYNPKFRRGYFPNPNWNVPIATFFAIYNDKATIRRRQLEGYA